MDIHPKLDRNVLPLSQPTGLDCMGSACPLRKAQNVILNLATIFQWPQRDNAENIACKYARLPEVRVEGTKSSISPFGHTREKRRGGGLRSVHVLRLPYSALSGIYTYEWASLPELMSRISEQA